MSELKRQDDGLAFMLKYENVAWYEDGCVRILDRRIYPIKTEFVVCKTHGEVAQAIADMVTQSAGPYAAAAMGMVLAAHELRDADNEGLIKGLTDAAYTLSHARPTTAAKMERITGGALKVALAAIENGISGQALVDVLMAHAIKNNEDTYGHYDRIAHYLADLIPKDGTIMTQCFAEMMIGQVLRASREKGSEIKFICPETRPYFQGARLTASVACDMGADVTVITDNMPAWTMHEKHVDLFTSAADVITVDGHVVNKVGTFQIALAAKYHGVPYYTTGTPNTSHPDADSVTIEQRDPALVMDALGTKTTMDGVKGYYPAFDITPPELITGIVTDLGVYKADDLKRYLKDREQMADFS